MWRTGEHVVTEVETLVSLGPRELYISPPERHCNGEIYNVLSIYQYRLHYHCKIGINLIQICILSMILDAMFTYTLRTPCDLQHTCSKAAGIGGGV